MRELEVYRRQMARLVERVAGRPQDGTRSTAGHADALAELSTLLALPVNVAGLEAQIDAASGKPYFIPDFHRADDPDFVVR